MNILYFSSNNFNSKLLFAYYCFLRGVHARRLKSGRFINIQTVILQYACHVTSDQTIIRRIGK